MEYTPNSKIGNFEIKKKKLAKNWLVKNQPKKKVGKIENKKKVGKKLARKISQLPHFRNHVIDPRL